MPPEAHLVNNAERCDICGDEGVSDAIVICTGCKVFCEHCYCMRTVLVEYPETWYCEDCKCRNEKISSTSSMTEEFAKKSAVSPGKMLHQSTQPNKLPNDPMQNLGRKKWIPSRKTKPISAEEVIKLSSGSLVSPKKFSCQFNSVQRRNVTTVNTKPPAITRCIPLKSSPLPVKANPSLAPAPPKHFRPPTPTSSQMDVVAQQQVPQSLKGLRGKNVNEVMERKGILIQTTSEDHNKNSEDTIPTSFKEQTLKQSMRIRLEPQKCEPHSASTPFVHGQKNVRSEIQRTTSSVKLADFSSIASWKGRFKISNASKQLEISEEEIQAQPPYKVCRKVYELSRLMPEVLEFELVPRKDLWVDVFQHFCLDKRDIGLYFFPSNTERCKHYVRLLELMEAEDLAMRTRVEGAELLIFLSKLLIHGDCQKWKGRHFLWGVYKQNAMNAREVAGAAHESSEMDMDVDMVGGQEIGRPDVAVSSQYRLMM